MSTIAALRFGESFANGLWNVTRASDAVTRRRKGEDDSLLVALCRACHREVEFGSTGKRRTNEEKEEILADTTRRRLKAFEGEIREASDSRCFWCKGKTDTPPWAPRGTVSVIPNERGDHEGVWMCSVCDSKLNHDERGHARSDDEKIVLLSKRKSVRRYHRKPSKIFRFTKSFSKLNAMQREEILRAFDEQAHEE
jgi:hypothetical protein